MKCKKTRQGSKTPYLTSEDTAWKRVSKIADALEVSVDYLLGKTKMELDKQTLKRLEDIAKLPDENKNFVLNLIDMALRDFKVKKAHAS
jgi:hypothetical protein